LTAAVTLEAFFLFLVASFTEVLFFGVGGYKLPSDKGPML
jgi:hypothetical protein